MTEPAKAVDRWLAEARAGSKEALGQALEACRNYLLLVAQQQLDPALQAKGGASDLVQETFLEAQRDFDRFQGQTEAELLAWLRQLLLHNLVNFTRQFRETGKRQIAREVPLEASGAAGRRRHWTLIVGPSPSERAMAHEQVEALRCALERLPDDYRRVLTLRYQEERSFEEIGSLMGRSANAARKLFARAVERLQQEMDPAP
jgi:RNA polymerase sigma-70 factor (ECF subfamily)